MAYKHNAPPHKHADQFTVWDECSIKMENSSHGTMTFEEWCEAEAERLRGHGHTCHIRKKPGNKDHGETCAVYYGEKENG